MQEIFVSTDVETDGPIPGPHSMLSLGSAAFWPDRTLVSTFSANLNPLEGASPHPDTMSWWRDHPEAWEECRRDPRPPALVLREYADWVKGLPGKPVFVAYPAVFDFMFVYWYLMRFVGESPFSFAGLDIKSYAMALLGSSFHDTVKANLPAHWKEERPLKHIAVDDAIGQGLLFCRMLSERTRLLEQSNL